MTTATKTPLTEALGSLIADVRKFLGYRTQTDFSEALGISRTYVGYIESGRYLEEYRYGLPSASVLLKMSKLQGLPRKVQTPLRELAAGRDTEEQPQLMRRVLTVRQALLENASRKK